MKSKRYYSIPSLGLFILFSFSCTTSPELSESLESGFNSARNKLSDGLLSLSKYVDSIDSETEPRPPKETAQRSPEKSGTKSSQPSLTEPESPKALTASSKSVENESESSVATKQKEGVSHNSSSSGWGRYGLDKNDITYLQNNGVTLDEYAKWYASDPKLGRYDLVAWRKAGSTPEDYPIWKSMGIRYNSIKAYYSTGFNAVKTKQFYDAAGGAYLSSGDAEDLTENGIDLETFTQWKKYGLSVPDMVRWEKANVTFEEYLIWDSMGVTAHRTGGYYKAGFDAVKTKEFYVTTGVLLNPQEASKLTDYGIELQEFIEWRKHDLSIDSMIRWKNVGATPNEYLIWNAIGVNSDLRSAYYYKAGFDAGKTKEFYDAAGGKLPSSRDLSSLTEAGIDVAEFRIWHQYGFPVGRMISWKKMGATHEEFPIWKSLGVKDPWEFYSVGVDAWEAQKWVESAPTLEVGEIVYWRKNSSNLQDFIIWNKYNLKYWEVDDYYDAGISASEAQNWFALGIFDIASYKKYGLSPNDIGPESTRFSSFDGIRFGTTFSLASAKGQVFSDLEKQDTASHFTVLETYYANLYGPDSVKRMGSRVSFNSKDKKITLQSDFTLEYLSDPLVAAIFIEYFADDHTLETVAHDLGIRPDDFDKSEETVSKKITDGLYGFYFGTLSFKDVRWTARKGNLLFEIIAYEPRSVKVRVASFKEFISGQRILDNPELRKVHSNSVKAHMAALKTELAANKSSESYRFRSEKGLVQLGLLVTDVDQSNGIKLSLLSRK